MICDKTIVDVNYSFTEDTPNFWDNYWQDEMGKSYVDPDAYSKKLKLFHKVLWSKKLPNGDYLDLKDADAKNYLTWENFRFGSDSITASFRYKDYRHMIKKVIDCLPNYKEYIENYTKQAYTIGGAIIFPKRQGGINQARGCNAYIRDRFDLTLECIRLYYNNQESPLYKVLDKDKDFFNLFVDFKGYVDFFFLQDLVSEDYKNVKFLIGNGNFEINPFPKTINEYLTWMNNQLEFVDKRNKRIERSLD